MFNGLLLGSTIMKIFHCIGMPNVAETSIRIRVARWYIFKPKIPIRVTFGGP
jgi:hypothetical protein